MDGAKGRQLANLQMFILEAFFAQHHSPPPLHGPPTRPRTAATAPPPTGPAAHQSAVGVSGGGFCVLERGAENSIA